ncbi:MAG: aldo/keto reductase [Rhodospirillales bacterium]|jgi:aryl-alcohol dehydrogenase-like predicted oxidoreductase|nr:aldo/keto reductase [Rhodospirillales bacterium]
MQFTELGRTGLRVSVAGLGGGGDSRLGLIAGKSEAEIARIIARALDLGINVIDCAHTYGTEEVIGRALAGGAREKAVLSSKYYVREKGEFHDAQTVIAGLDQSLRDLKTDRLDIFFLHGLTAESYVYARDVIAPAILKEKEKGKFRFLGITEAPPRDLNHEGLSLALEDDLFDVAMLAFSPTNQGARLGVLPRARKQGMGTYIMYVGRFAADMDQVRSTLRALAQEGAFPADLAARDNPLDFLIHEGGAADLMDAAYRYTRHASGGDVIMFGTGNPDHLEKNVASLTDPPLKNEALARLDTLFGDGRAVGVKSAKIYGLP